MDRSIFSNLGMFILLSGKRNESKGNDLNETRCIVANYALTPSFFVKLVTTLLPCMEQNNNKFLVHWAEHSWSCAAEDLVLLSRAMIQEKGLSFAIFSSTIQTRKNLGRNFMLDLHKSHANVVFKPDEIEFSIKTSAVYRKDYDLDKGSFGKLLATP